MIRDAKFELVPTAELLDHLSGFKKLVMLSLVSQKPLSGSFSVGSHDKTTVLEPSG